MTLAMRRPRWFTDVCPDRPWSSPEDNWPWVSGAPAWQGVGGYPSHSPLQSPLPHSCSFPEKAFLASPSLTSSGSLIPLFTLARHPLYREARPSGTPGPRQAPPHYKIVILQICKSSVTPSCSYVEGTCGPEKPPPE